MSSRLYNLIKLFNQKQKEEEEKKKFAEFLANEFVKKYNLRKINDTTINNMEKEIQYQRNINEQYRREIDAIRYEQRQNEEQRRNKELQERQNAINQCKLYLNKEFNQSIQNSFEEYNKIESNWIKQITKNDIEKSKKQFSFLFNNLFDSEKVINKIENKFIEQINKNYHKKELEKMNFMIIGASGIGKSTLINALFGEDNLAEEGLGGACTKEIKKYESQKYPFLGLYDSVGAELGKNHTLEDIQNETIDVIVKQLSNPDPNEHIHCIIYCVTSNRFFEDESQIILKIRDEYDRKRLPIVIAYTMGNDDEKVLAIKNKIDEYLKKNGESITDDISDIFGIHYLPLYAKEKNIKVSGKNNYQKCFGLSNLISICYKKGEQSYKIAIQNSLKQIAKDYFLNNIDNIAKKIENDKNLLSFLEQNFEPNFSTFISFLFEKITNNNINKYIKKNNLNPNSNNEINQLCKQYKDEMLKIEKNKFDKFVEEQSEKIYFNILEKFNQGNWNFNIGEAIESKSQLKNRANESIIKELKVKAEENFLKRSISLLFLDIIGVFKIEMKKKINDFIKNLDNYKEIKKFFKNIDANKEKKIGEDFKNYIKILKEIEKKSDEKSKIINNII